MIIGQSNKNNVGIEDIYFPGYQHGDGLTSEGHPAHESIKHDMRCFAEDLVKMYPNARNFLDIGSGAGYLSQRLREFGDNYIAVTIDGNRETPTLPSINNQYHFVVRTDLEYNLVDENGDTIKFDVITCFEHFEHIQKENFETFISNIKRHMNEDTVLYASAANWNYTDEDRVHVNVKSESEWKTEMATYGFEELDLKLYNDVNTSMCRLRWDTTAELCYKLKIK